MSNAYVSGMKEDLHMYGNEFNVRASVGLPRTTNLTPCLTENKHALHLRLHRRHDPK